LITYERFQSLVRDPGKALFSVQGKSSKIKLTELGDVFFSYPAGIPASIWIKWGRRVRLTGDGTLRTAQTCFGNVQIAVRSELEHAWIVKTCRKQRSVCR
jgi:hypothetical protein